MIFASFEFLFLFLPLFFAAYTLTPARARNVTILLFSWGFYGWWRVDFLFLLVAVTLFTWSDWHIQELLIPWMRIDGPRSGEAFAAAVDDQEIADLVECDQRVVPGAGVVVDAFAVGGEEAAWRVIG